MMANLKNLKISSPGDCPERDETLNGIYPETDDNKKSSVINLNSDIYKAIQDEFGPDKVKTEIYNSDEFDKNSYEYSQVDLPDITVKVFGFPPEKWMGTQRHIMIDVNNHALMNFIDFEFTKFDPSMDHLIQTINDCVNEVKK